ncbi:MAG: aminoacyl-tRNA hydrolase [Deltaproteobacteria bacterium]|nr:aminoacyl-tRNA hydrolase [Deltaproteobacteria bacterium]
MPTDKANKLKKRDFTTEFSFSPSRSSGAGGQNVNKVNTKVELRFNIFNSKLLPHQEKDVLLHKLATKINGIGELIIVSQESRSQLQNKLLAEAKFYQLIEKALQPIKRRKASKPTKGSKEKRLESKHARSQTKSLRRYRED